jgi:protein-S-isoprenylcysteine O-methyltransferase Ste14
MATNARKILVPRWVAVGILGPLVWLVAIPLVHGVLPWAISLVGPRWGWTAGSPSLWNLLGLVAVAAGVVDLVWVMIAGYSQARRLPERVELGWKPQVLITRGPYAYTRNPIYLGEQALWFGWVIFFGSWPVLVVISIAMLCGEIFRVVPREERALEAAFGETYVEYKARVPRWIGRRHGVNGSDRIRPPR